MMKHVENNRIRNYTICALTILLFITGLLFFGNHGRRFWQNHQFTEAKREGRELAENDWDDRTAVLYIDNENMDVGASYPDGTVGYSYDKKTGLRLAGLFKDDENPTFDVMIKAYSRRVRELLQERGIPNWSMKEYLVADSVLLDYLDSPEMLEVKDFPYLLNKYLSLVRPEENGLIYMESSLSGRHKIQNTIGESIFVAHHPQNTETVFIRNGKERVIALYKGFQIGLAIRE